MTRDDEMREKIVQMMDYDLKHEPERNMHTWLYESHKITACGYMDISEVDDYLDSTLQEDRADDIRLHITKCPRCKDMVEQEMHQREEVKRYDAQRVLELKQKYKR